MPTIELMQATPNIDQDGRAPDGKGPASLRYRSGSLEYDVETATVHGEMGAVRLRKQIAETLKLLMQRAPALVSTDELLDTVWGRQSISPSAVPQAIKDLRRLIGDSAQSPTFIETRHRLGYRWLLPVQTLHSPHGSATLAPAATAVPDAVPESPIPSRTKWLWVAAIALATAAILLFRQGDPGQTDTLVPSALGEAIAAQRLLDSGAVLFSLPADRQDPHADRLRIAAQIARGSDGLNAQLSAARAKIAASDRYAAAWLDLLTARANGRELDALAAAERLLVLAPADTDVLLAAFDLRKHLPKARTLKIADALLADPAVPPPRRALLEAQRATVEQNQGAAALRAAQISRDGAGVIAAQADLMVAGALPDLDQRIAGLAAASDRLAVLGERRLHTRARMQLIAAWMAKRQFDKVAAELDALEATLTAQPDPAALRVVGHYRAWWLTALNRDEEAVVAYLALSDQYRDAGDPGAAANMLNSTAAPLYRLARANELPAVLERALGLASQATVQDTTGYVLGSLGNYYVREGNAERAQGYYLRALEAFQIAGLPAQQRAAFINLSALSIQRGNLSEALSYAERAQALRDKDAAGADYAFLQVRMSTLLAGLGRLPDAAARADQAMTLFRQDGDAKESASAALLRGELALRQANLSGAEELAKAARSGPDPGAVGGADLLHLDGRIDFLRGQFEAAASAFAQAAAARNQANEPADALLTEIAQIEIKLALGNAVAAEETARALLQRPLVVAQPRLERAARLVLCAALVGRKRNLDLAAELDRLDTLLRQAPDAEDALKVALLRTELDFVRDDREQRLDWIEAQALKGGMQLLVLRVQGSRAARRGESARRQWLAQIAATGISAAALMLSPPPKRAD